MSRAVFFSVRFVSMGVSRGGEEGGREEEGDGGEKWSEPWKWEFLTFQS